MNVKRFCNATSVFAIGMFLLAGSASAQNRIDRRVPLQKLLDNVNRLSPDVRKHLSPGLQNYLRYATAAVNGAAPATSVRPEAASQAIGLATPSGAGPGGTIQVSNPAMDPARQGFTQSTTSSAWCGNSIVVGYEDTGAFFRTDPKNVSGVPISLDGVSFSTDAGSHFTDIGFLTPGTFAANALLGDPVVTCSSPTHFQYASILNTTTPDGIDPIIGPSVSFSTDSGKSWSKPQQVVSLDGNTELADKPWLAVDPTNPRRMYLTYTHFSFLGCINIELVGSADAGKTWTKPSIVRADCDNAGVGMVTGSSVLVSPGGKVYVAYEFFPVPPAGASFVKNAIYFTRSVDQGRTFSKPFNVSDVVSGGDGVELNGHVLVDEYPQIAVDRTNGASRGTVYVTWPDARNKIVPDANAPTGTYAYPDIFVAKSTDMGVSFKTLGAVSRTPNTFTGIGRDQFLPGIAVDKDGEVAVCYYDRRNDKANLRVDRYCSVSENQGKSWSDVRASSLNWMPAFDPDALDPNPGNGIGKYDALTSEFLLQSGGFFGAFEIEIGGNPNIVAKKF